VNVLVVEDDQAVARALTRGLQREGYDVTHASCAADALRAPEADVVLLDIGLPDTDGYAVCRQIRERSDVPVIMLTARGEEMDRVLGLELGADDYVVKPFGLREVVARIRAVTRRRAAPPAAAPEEGPQQVGRLQIDRRTRRVHIDGTEIALTTKEFDLLSLLASDPDGVIGRIRILEEVWDPHWYGPTKTLDVHVASLRRKLGDPTWIETIRGVGFRLRPLG